MPRRERLTIIDTSVLATTGLPVAAEGSRLITVSSVIEELKKRSPDKYELLLPLLGSHIEVIDSIEEYYISLVKEKAEETMDEPRLSSTDIRLAALALKLASEGYTVKLLTNDTALQNLCRHLKLEASGTFMTIKREINWVYYCPACRQKFKKKPPRDLTCPRCGSRVKYKPSSKSS